jgi:hypothetical protein
MSFTDGDGKRVIKIKSSSVARPKQGGIVEYPKEGCARNRVHREELFEECSNGWRGGIRVETWSHEKEATSEVPTSSKFQKEDPSARFQGHIPKPENAPKRSRNQYRCL